MMNIMIIDNDQSELLLSPFAKVDLNNNNDNDNDNDYRIN